MPEIEGFICENRCFRYFIQGISARMFPEMMLRRRPLRLRVNVRHFTHPGSPRNGN